MLRVEAYVVTEGLHVRVHAVCTGMAHEGQQCIPFGVSTIVPTLRMEHFGVRAGLVHAVAACLADNDELVELIMH